MVGKMLDNLLRFIEPQDIDDCDRLTFAQVSFGQQTVELRVHVLVDYERPAVPWTIRATGVREFELKRSHVAPQLRFVSDPNLPVLRQHTDPKVGLCFSAAARSSDEAIVALWKRHRDVAGELIPFNKYLNDLLKLEVLLSRSGGRLADGPEFLMKEYEQVLEAQGMGPTLIDGHPALWWDGFNWVPQVRPLSMFAFDEGYVVAEDFVCQQLPG